MIEGCRATGGRGPAVPLALCQRPELEATIADLRSQLKVALHELMQWRPTDEAMSRDKLELDSWRKQARAWQAAHELASEQLETAQEALAEAEAQRESSDRHAASMRE